MTTAVPAALDSKQLIVVDVEGNGQQPPEIIELAALPIDTLVAAAGIRTWRIRPQQEITPVVTRKVHGISNVDVADCPPWSDVEGDIGSLLADRTLVAHNASVEYRILTRQLPSWRPPMVLDTLRLAKYVWPGLNSYGLDQLVARTRIDTSSVSEQRHHCAGYDTWCAWQLLRLLVENGRLDWVRLVRAAALPGVTRLDEPDGGLW